MTGRRIAQADRRVRMCFAQRDAVREASARTADAVTLDYCCSETGLAIACALICAGVKGNFTQAFFENNSV